MCLLCRLLSPVHSPGARSLSNISDNITKIYPTRPPPPPPTNHPLPSTNINARYFVTGSMNAESSTIGWYYHQWLEVKIWFFLSKYYKKKLDLCWKPTETGYDKFFGRILARHIKPAFDLKV